MVGGVNRVEQDCRGEIIYSFPIFLVPFSSLDQALTLLCYPFFAGYCASLSFLLLMPQRLGCYTKPFCSGFLEVPDDREYWKCGDIWGVFFFAGN